ncbi:MAG: sigma-54-dependent transcriptional regulator [Candidatus Binatia bacterium]
MHEHILVIDDEEHMLALFESVLGKAGYAVTCITTAEEALHVLATRNFDAIISDLLLPGMDGMALLRQVKALRPTLPYILLTGHGTVRSAVEAMKEGATDYLTKPVDTDELKLVIAKALELSRLTREVEQLRAQVAMGHVFPHIIGRSKPMQALLRLVDLVAGSDATVLLQGESGTGKELIARAIHGHSGRSQRPFVILDCGTVPESLLESELFGYTKGAFTGAMTNKKGLFEEAHGGTLFLDEVGDITPMFQAKLLRVLQTGEIRPIGSTRRAVVDVRVIAATNRDLKERVAQRQFRDDLYYRLAVVPLRIPPLRDRREDIPLLIEHFLARSCQRNGRETKAMSPAALRILLDATWPGNVRELEHTIERAVVLTSGAEIPSASIILESAENRASALPSWHEVRYAQEVLDNVEREKLRAALAQAKGNRSRAAKVLGISRSTLYEKLKLYRLNDTDGRSSSRLSGRDGHDNSLSLR